MNTDGVVAAFGVLQLPKVAADASIEQQYINR